jgi:death-on-curing family protein
MNLKLSWNAQPFPFVIRLNNWDARRKLGKEHAKAIYVGKSTESRWRIDLVYLTSDGSIINEYNLNSGRLSINEVKELVTKYATEKNIGVIIDGDILDNLLFSFTDDRVVESSLRLSAVDMPNAEQDSAYDLTTNPAPEETEQYTEEYKKEENNPLQNRYEPQNEEKFFEKGLHQSIEKPQTERPLTPYGSLRLSAEPTPEQKDAGNYKKQHVRKDGLDISIENKKGSTRSGTSSDGKKWSIEMKNPYGYIKGTVGKDKDSLDCFLSNDYKEEQPVFIVNQSKKGGSFDEHKILLGFKDKDSAEKAYVSNYEKGWDQYKNIVEMPMTLFKTWMVDKKLTQEPVPEDLQFKKIKASMGFTDTDSHDRSFATMEGEVEVPINELSVVFKNTLPIFDDYAKFTLVKGKRPNFTDSMSTKYILYGVDAEGFSHIIKETYYGEKSPLEYLYNKCSTPKLMAASLKVAYQSPADPEDLLKQGRGGKPFVYDRRYHKLYTGPVHGTHADLINDMAESHAVQDFSDTVIDALLQQNSTFEKAIAKRFYEGRISDNGDFCTFWNPPVNPHNDEVMDCIWELLSREFITKDCKLKFCDDPEYYPVNGNLAEASLVHALSLPSNAEILQLYNKYAKGYDYTKEVFNLRDKLVPSLEALIENSDKYSQALYDNEDEAEARKTFLENGGIEDYVSLGMNVGNVQKAISMLSFATDDKQCMVAVDYALSIVHDSGPLILTTLVSDMPDYERLEQMLELLSQLRYQGELRESTSSVKTAARATDRIFVCLWLPKEVEERFDHIHGLEDELHMTVAYAATSKLSEDNKQAVLNSLSKVAKDYSKIKCKFTGIAALRSPERPIVALINVQDGAEFHLDIINAIKKTIGEWDKKYDFIPHVTLQTCTNGRSKLKDLKRFSWTAHTIGVAFNDTEKYLIDLDTGRVRKSLAKQANILNNAEVLMLNYSEDLYGTKKKLAGTVTHNKTAQEYSTEADNSKEPGAYQETSAAPDAGTSQGNAEAGIVNLTADDIVILHDEAVSKYGGARGSEKDTTGKVEAAIGRMLSGFGTTEFYPTLFEKAAVLAHSIITTHPFVDGNKRTAFLSAVTFLHNNGITVEESDQLADIIIKVASSGAGYEHLLQWIQQNAHELEEKHEKALKLLSHQVTADILQELREGKGIPFIYYYDTNYLWVGSSSDPHANAMDITTWKDDSVVGRVSINKSVIAFWNPADLPRDTAPVLYCLMVLQQKGVLAANAIVYFVDDATPYTKQQLQSVTAALKLSTPETYTDHSDVDQSVFNNTIDQFHQEDHRDINNGRDWMWGETDYKTGFPDPSNENVVQKLDQEYPEALLADSALKLSWQTTNPVVGMPVKLKKPLSTAFYKIPIGAMGIIEEVTDINLKIKIESWNVTIRRDKFTDLFTIFKEVGSSLKLSWKTPIIGMKVKSKRNIYSRGHRIPKGEIAEIIRLTPMILLSFSGFKVVITNNSFYDDFEEVYTKSSLKLASDDAAFNDYSTDRGLKLMYYDKDTPTGDQATDMHQIYDTDLRLPDNQKTEKEFDTTNWVGRENMVPAFGV